MHILLLVFGTFISQFRITWIVSQHPHLKHVLKDVLTLDKIIEILNVLPAREKKKVEVLASEGIKVDLKVGQSY